MPDVSQKFYVEYIEFYINHTCNFNCPGCTKFNNFHFDGVHRWEDYAQDYFRWADRLRIDRWSVMGGEPMMNPSYRDYLKGIHQLWPEANGSLLTNGHYLRSDDRELYEFFKSTNGQVFLDVGLHNINRREEVFEKVKRWLVGPLEISRRPENIRDLMGFDENWRRSYENIKDPTWPACDTVDDWQYLPQSVKDECIDLHKFSPEIWAETRKDYTIKDDNGVVVRIGHENFFHQGPLIRDGGRFRLHSSDKSKAHSNCANKYCHNFVKGRLYKCGQVAVWPDFYEQFHFDLDKSDTDLLHSYRSAGSDDTDDFLYEFIGNLKNPIDQCKFCPEFYDHREIFSEHKKKIKIEKKS